MAQHIAPTKNGATSGAPFTLLATDTVLLNLCPADTTVQSALHNSHASVQLQTSAGGWIEVFTLDAKNPAHLLQGPGTYRVVLKASADSVGVDKT
jgi:hypothetical protein